MIFNLDDINKPELPAGVYNLYAKEVVPQVNKKTNGTDIKIVFEIEDENEQQGAVVDNLFMTSFYREDIARINLGIINSILKFSGSEQADKKIHEDDLIEELAGARVKAEIYYDTSTGRDGNEYTNMRFRKWSKSDFFGTEKTEEGAEEVKDDVEIVKGPDIDM